MSPREVICQLVIKVCFRDSILYTTESRLIEYAVYIYIQLMSRAFKLVLRFCIRQFCLFASLFCPTKTKREAIRERGDDWVIRLFRPEIEAVIEAYPSVRCEEDTLDTLVQSGKSIARFGDGELKLLVGERHKSFQDVDEALNQRMLEVLRSDDPNVLVAIHPVRDFDGQGRIWRKFMIRIGREVLALLDSSRTYESTGVFHLLPDDDKDAFLKRVSSIKRLWADRKVLIVVGKNSRFRFEPDLFDNVASVDYVYAPPKNAFYEYDSIMQSVQAYDKDEYLVLLVLGPTATVMAYDLGKLGYQAIDFGQMPGKYRKISDKLLGNGAQIGSA